LKKKLPQKDSVRVGTKKREFDPERGLNANNSPMTKGKSRGIQERAGNLKETEGNKRTLGKGH